MLSWKQIIFWIFLFFAAGLSLSYWLLNKKDLPQFPKIKALYGQVGSFDFMDQERQSVTAESLKGKVWIADFIFTRCQDVCPMMSVRMKTLYEALPGISFVSFTVDPEYDTPEILAEYASHFEADPRRWMFLTGNRESLEANARSFKVSGVEEPMFHSTSFFLVDASGTIQGHYDSKDTESMNQLKRDAQKLLG